MITTTITITIITTTITITIITIRTTSTSAESKFDPILCQLKAPSTDLNVFTHYSQAISTVYPNK